LKKEKIANHLISQRDEAKKWNPYNDQNIKGDPFKTIVVSRLSYKTDEKRLRKEFEIFGPIKKCKVVID